MTAYAVTAAELRQFIERVERLEEDRREIAGQIREVYAEAKARGYDARAMKEIVRLRKLDPQDLSEREAVVQLYREALGDLASTPLGQWAQKEAAE